MTGRSSQLLHPLRIASALVLMVVLASGVVRAVTGIDVSDHLGPLSVCPFHWLTETPCPGCGMTRALLLLGQLRISEALTYHPLVPVVAIAMAWTVAGNPGRRRVDRASVRGASLVLVVGLWLVRLMLGTAPA